MKLTSCIENVSVEQKQIVVYYPDNGWFPAWMKRYFKTEILKISSKILDERTGVISAIQNGFEILLSSPERALIEMLSLSPGCYNLKALYLIMKQLTDLNPALVQSLLEQCKSIKTKRLFLFMAEKTGHGWFDALNIFKIDLGDGKREVVVNGIYIPKYRMVVPDDLENF